MIGPRDCCQIKLNFGLKAKTSQVSISKWRKTADLLLNSSVKGVLNTS